GKLAEQILQIAFQKGVKVREDADLAELLVKLDLDTPIPSEAIVAVAEILARVYEANARAGANEREDLS
ncbi:MAG: EscU/YscU/HrcU family type III secretion system export apparatus switch protein, partial [Pseudomonadota bacterium]|nr:EscU/YscU/HrcU family type III secretion system export apparatus switch protein [Pseudomonadota bacterium]